MLRQCLALMLNFTFPLREFLDEQMDERIHKHAQKAHSYTQQVKGTEGKSHLQLISY